MELKQTTIPKEENLEIIAVDQETGELYVPKTVIDHLTEIKRAKKEFESYEEFVKTKLKEAMEEYGVTKIDTDELAVNYVSEGEQTKVDSKLLQEMFPETYNAVTKVSTVKPHVRMKLK